MGGVANIWRHPIKSHGREALETVRLSAGKTMPWDRHWAVTHQASKFDPDHPEWTSCGNFMRGASTPGVAGIWSKLDEDSGMITLSHEALGEITFAPDEPSNIGLFLSWLAPLCPAEGRQPAAIVAAPDRGMTDSADPTISIMTTASHRAVEGRLGRKLEQERWRGNIWLDGPAAWEELEWVGQRIRIGTAEFDVIDPIERCKQTMANPKTGKRDADTLGVLREGWDHQLFGVATVVVKDGDVALGDTYEVL